MLNTNLGLAKPIDTSKLAYKRYYNMRTVSPSNLGLIDANTMANTVRTYKYNNRNKIYQEQLEQYLQQQRQQQQGQEQDKWSDPNDPVQIHGIVDAVLTTFRDDMKREDHGGAENIPILNIFTSLYDLGNKNIIDPIAEGDYSRLFNNLMVGLGDDLDVLSAPIKNMAMAEDKSASGLWEALKSSFGMGAEGTGRTVKNWDTGSWLGDIALETLSDPATWVSLGGAAAAKIGTAGTKAGAKAVVKTAITDGLENTAKNTNNLVNALTDLRVKDAVLKRAKAGLNTTAQEVDIITRTAKSRVTEDVLKKFSKSDKIRDALRTAVETGDFSGKKIVNALSEAELKQADDVVQKTIQRSFSDYFNGVEKASFKNLSKNIDPDLKKLVTKNYSEILSKGKTSIFSDKLTENVTEALRYADFTSKEIASTRIMQNINKVMQTSELVDEVIAKIAWAGTGLYEAKALIKHGGSAIGEYLSNAKSKRLNPYLKKDNTLDISLITPETFTDAKLKIQAVEDAANEISGVVEDTNKQATSELSDYITKTIESDLHKMKKLTEANSEKETQGIITELQNAFKTDSLSEYITNYKNKLEDVRNILKDNDTLTTPQAIKLHTASKELTAMESFLDKLSKQDSAKSITSNLAIGFDAAQKEITDLLNVFKTPLPETADLNALYNVFFENGKFSLESIRQLTAEGQKLADYVCGLKDTATKADLPYSKYPTFKTEVYKALIANDPDIIRKASKVKSHLSTLGAQSLNIAKSEYTWGLHFINDACEDLYALLKPLKEILENNRDLITEQTIRKLNISDYLKELDSTAIRKVAIEDLEKSNKATYDLAMRALKASMTDKPEKSLVELLGYGKKKINPYSNHAPEDKALFNKLMPAYTKALVEALTTPSQANIDAFGKVALEKLNKYLRKEIDNYPAFIAEAGKIQPDVVHALNTLLQFNPKAILTVKGFGDYSDAIYKLQRLVNNAEQPNTLYAKTKSNLRTILETFNPVATLNNVVSAQSGGLVRRLQMDKTLVTASLLNIAPINRVIEDTANGTGLGNIIKTFSNLPENAKGFDKFVVPICTELEYLFKAITNHKDLLNTIAQSTELDDSVKTVLVEVLGNYHLRPISDFQLYLKSNISKICDNVETLLNTKTQDKSLSLVALKDDPEIAKVIKERFGDVTSHYADSDVRIQRAMRDTKLSKYFNDPTQRYIDCDIETFGFNANKHSILQIAYMDPDTQEVTLLKRHIDTHTETNPITGVPELVADNLADVPDAQLLRNLFENYDKDPDGTLQQFYQLYSGEGLSEKEMLEYFVNHIPSKDPRIPNLVFHNGDKFDIDFIKKRMRACEVDGQTFNKANKTDTLKLLQKDAGYSVLTANDKSTIAGLLDLYTTKQSAIAEQYPTLAHKYLFETPDENMVKLFNSLNDKLLKQTSFTDLQAITSYCAADLTAMLSNTSKMNTSLAKAVIDPRVLQPDTVFYKAFISNLKDAVQGNAEAIAKELNCTPDELINNFEKYINISKLVSGNTIKPSVVNYKNIINTPSVKNHFKLPTTVQRSLDTLMQFSEIGDEFNRELNKIVNTDLIKQPAYMETYRSFLADISQQLLTPKLHAVLNNLDYNQLTPEKLFVYAKYFYNEISELDEKTCAAALKKYRKLDAIELLNSALPYYHNSGKIVRPHLVDVPAYRELKENVIKSGTGLKEFNLGLDKHNLTSGRMQAFATALDEAQTLIDTAQTIFDGSLSPALYHSRELKLQQITEDYCLEQLNTVLKYSPDELLAHLSYNAPWIEFAKSDIGKSTSLSESLNKLLTNSTEYEAKHIKVFDKGDRIYICLDDYSKLTKQLDEYTSDYKMYYNGELINANPLKECDLLSIATKHSDGDTPLLHYFKKYTNAKNKLNQMSYGASVGTLGDTINEDWLTKMYKQLPDDVKNCIPMSCFDAPDFWKTTHYNFINVGSTVGRSIKDVNNSTDLLMNCVKGSEVAIQHAKTSAQYVELLLNSSMSVKELRESGADIAQLLADNSDYTLAALVKDSKSKLGCRVVSVNPKSLKHNVADVERLNTILVPNHVYSAAVETINSARVTSTAEKIYRRFMYLYKIGYLIKPGTSLRNYIDSTMKNATEMGDVSDAFKYQVIAAHLIKQYNEIFENICKLSPAGLFLDENISAYFTQFSKEINEATFRNLHSVMNSTSTIGLASSMKSYLISNGMFGAEDEGIWGKIVGLSNKALTPMTYVEQVQRLALYLSLDNKGLSNTVIYKRIANTHFDYASKEGSARIMSLLFPFYTFKLNNMQYWLNAIDEHPWLSRVLSNIMTPIMDLDDNHNEMQNNQSLMYQIMSGNIELNDTGITLKTSPSFMDALNTLINPIDTLSSSTFAPLREALSAVLPQQPSEYSPMGYFLNSPYWQSKQGTSVYSEKLIEVQQKQKEYDEAKRGERETGLLESLVPILGTLHQTYVTQSEKYYGRTGNLLNRLFPDIFGATAYYDNSRRNYEYEYTPKKYFNRGYVKSPAKKYAHYTPRSYGKKVYKKRIYPSKTYAKMTYTKDFYREAPYNYGRTYGKKALRKTTALKSYARKVYPRMSYVPLQSYQGKLYSPRKYQSILQSRTYKPWEHVSFYSKYYSKTNKWKMENRKKVYTPKYLRMRINDLKNYYR